MVRSDGDRTMGLTARRHHDASDRWSAGGMERSSGIMGTSGPRASDGKVELKDQLICVLGDVAYEVGVECPEFKHGGEKVAGQIRVTNIYLREEDVRAQSCPATST